MQQIDDFLKTWEADPLGTKKVFQTLLAVLQDQSGAGMEFHARPGISYSLRGVHANGHERPLFVMIDVIDDDPAQRWLSVCFYGDTIEDPDERGDLIPGGLLGADGYCFDLDEADDALVAYVGERIKEAYKSNGA